MAPSVASLAQALTKAVFRRGRPEEEDEDAFPDPVGKEALIITFRELPCQVVYAYVACAILCWLGWALYRRAVHRALEGSTAERRRAGGGLQQPLLKKPEKPQVPLCKQSLTDSQGRVVTFEGYRDCFIGKCASKLIPVTTVVVVLLFGIVLFDYYYGCAWEFPYQLCYVGTFPIFGTFNSNSRVFMAIWIWGVCWFFFMVWGSTGGMANMFRVKAPLREADYIHIAVDEKRQVVSSGYSRMLKLRDTVGRLLGRLMGFRGGGLPGGLFSLSGGPSQTVPMQRSAVDGSRFINFRCICYAFEEQAGMFHEYDPGSALPGSHEALARIMDLGGLRQGGGESNAPEGAAPSVARMYRAAGPNEIPFSVDSYRDALKEEFATFFFLYQFAVYAVCLWYSYWHFTVLAVSVAVCSALYNVKIKLQNQRKIKSMMEQSSKVSVMRSSQLVEIEARDIVPGDIVQVGQSWLVPCDLLLLKGAAVCDESTLTGESMPVQRLAPTESLKTVEKGQRFPGKHVLVAGTEVLQAAEDTWAVATHTGVTTQKGQLMLLILYPPKLLFKYDEQLGVVFLFLITYAVFVGFTSMKMMYALYGNEQHLPFTATWASSVFTVSCVLPTMLHIVLNVGTVVASDRLQHADVFCAAPKRISLGGKVRVVCFDKTGTLTTPSLEFYGVHCVERPKKAPSATGPFGGWVTDATQGRADGEDGALEAEPRKEAWHSEVHCGLACAHSLSPFSGSEAGVVGNAVEMNMFGASGWALPSQSEVTLGAPGPQQQKIDILRRFDFSHTTMTMSSVVEHGPSGERGVYLKGSFEQVAARCIKSTIPPGFAAKATRHAYSGMYVLALAARPLKREESENVANLTREDAERDLVMLGMLLFKNPLRSDTRHAIELLRGGEVRSVMITGDAAGTAIKIAKEAALVPASMPVLLGDVEADGDVVWRCDPEDLTTLNEMLLSNEWLTWRRNYKQWRQGDTKGSKGDASANKIKSDSNPRDLGRRASWSPGDFEDTAGQAAEGRAEEEFVFSTEELVLSRLFEWCELAVTQKALGWLENAQCSPDLRRVLTGSRMAAVKKGKALSSGKGNSSLAWELMTSIRIFARMTPAGKVNVVESLMSQGLICAMVGDGGNDSGALRAAHIGMALSSATAATVVAPFTTSRGSVAPIVDVCREGRAALATSFAGYKFMVHYGLLNSALKYLCYYYGVAQTMAACYFQDMLGLLSLSWAMTLSKPTPHLVGDRPTSSLFSVYTVSSVLGMWAINMLAYPALMCILSSSDDYVQFPKNAVLFTEWWKRSRNWENTAIFLTYSFQFFWSAVVFSFGHLFRLAWHNNVILFGLAGGGFCLLVLLLLGPTNSLTRTFHLAYELEEEHEPWTPANPCPAMPYSVRVQLAAMIGACMFVSGLWEKVFVQGKVGMALRSRFRRLSKHITVRL